MTAERDQHGEKDMETIAPRLEAIAIRNKDARKGRKELVTSALLLVARSTRSI